MMMMMRRRTRRRRTMTMMMMEGDGNDGAVGCDCQIDLVEAAGAGREQKRIQQGGGQAMETAHAKLAQRNVARKKEESSEGM
jgi:hypothetical protein